jgi:hypothetical protein
MISKRRHGQTGEHIKINVILNNFTKKAIFNGVSLAVILFLSTKLVSACTSVVCSNGTESNICAIEDNLITAQKYFQFTLGIFIFSSLIYFLRRGKGIIALAVGLISITLPSFLHYLNGGEECDFLTTKIIKWLFYFSMIAFLFQIISWISQRKAAIKLQ